MTKHKAIMRCLQVMNTDLTEEECRHLAIRYETKRELANQSRAYGLEEWCANRRNHFEQLVASFLPVSEDGKAGEWQ